MPAEGPGHSFTMRDGTVLSAREVARGIYLIMNDEPRLIFDKIWKFLEAEIPTDRRPQFEAAFLTNPGRSTRQAADDLGVIKARFSEHGNQVNRTPPRVMRHLIRSLYFA